MRLLITETDPFVRSWIAAEAARRGIELVFVDADDALDRIDCERPDCIALDASSSASREQPLWQSLARDPRLAKIPVLLYASSMRWRAVAQLAANEVTRSLQQPFTPADLVDAAFEACAA
ncbi:MAG: response regulator [Myxococcales bacterium]|nr:response regulator [Myxococcales bacterium]